MWRYLFVLWAFITTVQGICEGKTPILKGILIVFAITIFLDWFKMQFKTPKRTGSNYNPRQDQMFESSKWSCPAQMGSAWDPYTPGSSEYYIRQSRYS